jgi:ribonuclease-3
VPDLDQLQARLGHTFRDAGLLQMALTHPSLTHEVGPTIQHNQRLEFLGDAVLQLVLTQSLYETFPDLDEGPLTKARAQLVNSRTLAAQARRLDLGPCLLMSRGEELNGGRHRQAALADALEALLGAVYLDAGFEAARQVILGLFREACGELTAPPNLDNPKGELQEHLQARSAEPISYRLESTSGPDHDREFECSVSHGGLELGRGRGRSKKEAESRAAQAALERVRAESSSADEARPA